MRIGVPQETAPGERRVALVPESCKKLKQAGYEISLETGAGSAAGYSDAAYRELGVTLDAADAVPPAERGRAADAAASPPMRARRRCSPNGRRWRRKARSPLALLPRVPEPVQVVARRAGAARNRLRPIAAPVFPPQCRRPSAADPCRTRRRGPPRRRPPRPGPRRRCTPPARRSRCREAVRESAPRAAEPKPVPLDIARIAPPAGSPAPPRPAPRQATEVASLPPIAAPLRAALAPGRGASRAARPDPAPGGHPGRHRPGAADAARGCGAAGRLARLRPRRRPAAAGPAGALRQRQCRHPRGCAAVNGSFGPEDLRPPPSPHAPPAGRPMASGAAAGGQARPRAPWSGSARPNSPAAPRSRRRAAGW